MTAGILYVARTWVVGETVTAAEMNAEIRDPFNGLQAASTAFTPTISSGITLGNGTLTGTLRQEGKYVDAWIYLTFGTTTTVTATMNFNFPILTAAKTADTPVGLVLLRDSSAAGAGRYTGAAILNTSTAGGVGDFIIAVQAATANATSPFVWATSDRCFVHLRYEAA